MTIRGITFQIDQASNVLVGHGWVGDKVSGLVFGCVEEGPDRPSLRKHLNEMLDDIAEYALEASGLEPEWVGLGSDYTDPPKVGAPETWTR